MPLLVLLLVLLLHLLLVPLLVLLLHLLLVLLLHLLLVLLLDLHRLHQHWYLFQHYQYNRWTLVFLHQMLS
jgi:hypothetical protein